MKLTDPSAGLPRRELAGHELLTEFGLRFVLVTTRHESHVRKGGEVAYREKVVKYRLETRALGVVTFIKPGGEEYEVTRFGCTCKDAQYRGRAFVCKHREVVMELGLLEPVAALPGE